MDRLHPLPDLLPLRHHALLRPRLRGRPDQEEHAPRAQDDHHPLQLPSLLHGKIRLDHILWKTLKKWRPSVLPSAFNLHPIWFKLIAMFANSSGIKCINAILTIHLVSISKLIFIFIENLCSQQIYYQHPIPGLLCPSVAATDAVQGTEGPQTCQQ